MSGSGHPKKLLPYAQLLVDNDDFFEGRRLLLASPHHKRRNLIQPGLVCFKPP
jgi:hypothetical protein